VRRIHLIRPFTLLDQPEEDELPDDDGEELGGPTSGPPDGPLFLSRICLELSETTRQGHREAIDFLRKHREPLGLEGDDLLRAFLERVWPDQVPATLIASNVSFDLKHPEWLLRPVNRGPSAATYAAAHQTLAMNVYRRQGRLVVRRFELTPHVAPRDHEMEIVGPLFWNPSDLWMNREDIDALGELPFHRQETRQRLESWRQYLQWKEEWVKKQQLKVPYLAWRWDGETRMAFLVRQADLPERRLEGQELSVVPPEPQDEEKEQPKRRAPDPVGIGEAENPIPVDPRGRHARDRWEERHLSGTGALRQISLQLDEERALLLHKKEGLIPARGVLVSAIAGDLAPLGHQRRAIDRLQNSQGFCPRLADFLFAAGSASRPPEPPAAELEPIPGARPLNPGQAMAVAKAMAAPDLSLIQGPPGTGKTTVIGELCLRVARQGGRILVASQTNLAVDNALSRLADRPEIRRLRLGKADRVDDDYRDFLAENVVERWFVTITEACVNRIDETTQQEQEQARRKALLGDLRGELGRYRGAQANLQALRERMETLARERLSLDTKAREARVRADVSRRRVEALQALRAWCEGGAELPAGVMGADRTFEPLVLDIRARLAPEDGMRTREGLSLLEGVRGRAGALGSLRARLGDGRGRCDGELPEGGSPELAALLSERQRLSMSEDAADAVRLPELNRRIKALRKNGWSDFTRDFAHLAAEAFSGAPPRSAQRIINSLNPVQELLASFDELEEIVGRALSAAELVTHALAQRARDLGREIGRERGTSEAMSREADMAQAEVALRDEARDQLGEQRQQHQQELDAARERWNEAWHALHPGGPDAPPPPSADSLRTLSVRQQEQQREDSMKLDRRRRWRDIQQEWVQRLHSPSESDREHLQALYLRHANVVGMTCNEAGKRQVFEDAHFQPFDMVIIDEVSKATPTELIMPMLLGNKVVLVGDHRQLPPMFREKEASFSEAQAEGQIDKETFEKYRKMVTSSLFQELFEAAPEELKTMLWVQYRMHPQVMDAVNHFYGGRLQPGAPPGTADARKALEAKRQHHLSIRNDRGDLLLEPHQHLLWVDSSFETQGRAHWEQQRGTSKANRLEVELVLKMLRLLDKALQERGYGRHDPKDPFRVERSEAGLGLREFVRGRLGSVPESTLDDLFEEKRVRIRGRSQKVGRRVEPGEEIHIDARRQIGVLTFYGAQLKDLREAIQKEPGGFSALDLRTNTVDRFQGMELPIVIASLVRSVQGKMGDFVRQFQRINVGFSRAQELLVVIGASETFKPAIIDLPSLEGGAMQRVAVYNHIFDIAKTAGGRRHAWQLP
jgi:hypothetical protein